MTDIVPLDIRRHAQDLAITWQAQCLAESKGKLAAVMLVVIAHSYAQAMPILLRVVFPQMRDIARPFFCSPAVILKNGKIACDMINREGAKSTVVVYDNEEKLMWDFRSLADRLKLNDADRIEMTAAVKRWIVADHRINHLGQKLAS